MRKARMGGDKTLRLFLKGNGDLISSVFGAAGTQAAEARLRDVVREKYGGAFELEVTHELCARSDIMLQQVESPPDEEPLRRQGLGAAADALARQRTRLFERPMDVVVFSLQPEVLHCAWKHREGGYLVPSAESNEEATPCGQGPNGQFVPAGLLTASQSKENLLRLIRMVKERLDAHVVFYNCSSLDPEVHTHNYHRQGGDTVAERVHRLNLVLMQLSEAEGISIIDVERLIAEMGGQPFVLGSCRYSEQAHEAICRELLRVLEDIGFFEKRPLVAQIGRREKTPCS